MIKINLGEKSVSKLSYELLGLIRKKWKIEDIYYGIFNLLEEKKIKCYDVCYEYLTLLVIYCGDVLKDINYFRKMIKIICDSGMNSTNTGKLIEALYKNNRNNFMLTIKEQSQENQKKILFFLDNKNNNNSSINNNINSQQEKIQINNNKGKIIKIVNKNNNNMNNYLPDEIKIYINNSNIKSFMDFIENNKSCLPNIFMLLTEEKNNSNIKFVKNLLNFIFALIALKNNLIFEITQNMEILISQLIKCFLQQINNSNITDIIKEILNVLSSKTNSDKFYKVISKYLNLKNNEILLETILICIKNSIINETSEKLETQLPLFINGVFNMLNHDINEIRKYAVYCCVEIYKIIGDNFDEYLKILPKNQQNLINNFILRMGK